MTAARKTAETKSRQDTVPDAGKVQVVDLDSPELVTVLRDAAELGVDVNKTVVEAVDRAAEKAEKAARAKAAREARERRAAARAERQPKPEKYRPFWLTRPCPDWCQEPHGRDDPQVGRFHEGMAARYIIHDGLFQEGVERPADGLPYLYCGIRQQVQAGSRVSPATVVLQIDFGCGYQTTNLSPATARSCAWLLLERADAADAISVQDARALIAAYEKAHPPVTPEVAS